MDSAVHIWIDTGGTFTDCIGVWPDGHSHSVKVLSSGMLRGTVVGQVAPDILRVKHNWPAVKGLVDGLPFSLLHSGHICVVRNYEPVTGIMELTSTVVASPGDLFEVGGVEEAPILGARLLTGTPYGTKLPPVEMRVATTLGTNALLERRGSPPVLFITKGFGDLLLIGDQQRPDLFTLRIEKPQPLYAKVIEVHERLAADGTVLLPFSPESISREVETARREGYTSAAIALLHSYRHPDHEVALERYLRESGFLTVSRSSSLSPLLKILPRAQTAVTDAYLSPVLAKYVNNVRSGIVSGTLHLMTSAGGLVRAEDFRPKDCLFSGPAGGVVGSAAIGLAEGCPRAISFDMGGTSTDVSRFDGNFEYSYYHEVGQARLNALSLAIESVASGGGSICTFAGGRLRVGPQSAGATPGPACYGNGGPLTVTDVNLLLGRIDPTRFEIPIDKFSSRMRLAQTLTQMSKERCEEHKPDEILEGFIDIADELMAEAIRNVSIRRGYDPADYSLVAFGGAGPQHCCGVADRLGVTKIVVPAASSLLSALGLGHSRLERFAQRQVLRRLDNDMLWLSALIAELTAEASAEIAREGVLPKDILVRRRIMNLRFLGQESSLSVEYQAGESPVNAFLHKYESTYGHMPESGDIEVESIRVVVSTGAVALQRPSSTPSECIPAPSRMACAFLDGHTWELPIYDRELLSVGSRLDGPALVVDRHSCTFVRPGWSATASSFLSLILDRQERVVSSTASRPDVVQAEIFAARLSGFVDQMGEMLRRCAVSTNVKERLDYSCALLDPDGELVASAQHIPVHIGAIGLCVRSVLQMMPIGPGDAVITNSPAHGGTHLPDITVISPAFSESGRLLGYLANRAHHAEIGGISPGSMPAGARNLSEEGKLIEPRYIVKGGASQLDSLADLLSAQPYPSRAVAQNIADIRAALAANATGASALKAAAREFGDEALLAKMAQLKDRAEKATLRAIERIPEGRCIAEEFLDDATPLRLSVQHSGSKMDFDFTGTGPESAGSLNATPAIVTSAVLYVLRLLIGEPIDLNEGMLRAVSLRIPHGLLSPDFSRPLADLPAVAGGNVETSQRLVDLLLKAFHMAACSQGTMNNLAIGNHRFSYYETICGGVGALEGSHGADAVHTHMTNTRITDPEVIELRYPLRVEKFAIRKCSGGMGRYNGGDGVERIIRFLEESTVSLLSQHRTCGPYGMNGG
ncbi:MAG: hydantoinase B/oxoprolinase family protein, partial [Candidatus Brocadiia bacterium]